MTYLNAKAEPNECETSLTRHSSARSSGRLPRVT